MLCKDSQKRRNHHGLSSSRAGEGIKAWKHTINKKKTFGGEKAKSPYLVLAQRTREKKLDNIVQIRGGQTTILINADASGNGETDK